LKKEKENQELKNLFKSVRKVLAKKGLLNQEKPPQEKVLSKEESSTPLIPAKPRERRRFPRLNLARDFNRTIILRITQLEGNENIKSFANNISIGGICLETKREFRKNNKLNFRLFFYGDEIPMMKIQAHIIWKKKAETTNQYGASFDLIEEKDKITLSRYIESNIDTSLS